MSEQSTLAAGRAMAESRMRDTCTITRASADRVLDPATAVLAPAGTTNVYTGPCRVKGAGFQPGSAVAGERSVTSSAYIVSVPIAVVVVLPGDTLTVTAVDPDNGDPLLVGRSFTVGSPVPAETNLTARRLTCEAFS